MTTADGFALCLPYRTESVAEKMLTNWFTFLLYKFLKVSLRRAGKLHGQEGGSRLSGMGSMVPKAWADVPLSTATPPRGEIPSQASVAIPGF